VIQRDVKQVEDDALGGVFELGHAGEADIDVEA
jgi:hypothetical protein